ncbi:MAG: MarR family transcriptional regulator [Saprospiraceae bacterium]|nr:MarR family transcriptional regulator [Saprospiraceae bacterium]
MEDLKLEEVYLFLLERTVRQFRKYSQQLFEANDIRITGDQWVVLKRISENEGINQREIANLTYKDPASMTRILDLLEKQELVVRQPVENNRRTYALFLTKEGRTLVEKIIPLAISARKKGLENIQPEDAQKLMQVLNKMYENFE